ncbi:MAG: phosphoribosyl-AMP cyclohydrolase [Gammaproteobacteria bacterium]|nr:phosphoribosyl-AMP cyclohydrolase [Gammaproteobacteria bacterium]
MTERWLDQIVWDSNGLVPAIAQDVDSGEVLMLAWMSREALGLSLEHNRAVYWSRSRQKLWFKGEESGNIQQLQEIRIDCDADVVLLRVTQLGGIACHTGRRRCFFRLLKNGEWLVDEEIIKNPDEIYR